ncbi:MAG TPA: thioesterase family protein [Spirochaetota bacterium]|nr:thioesterase family protein [Spirochaetota bacterium]HPJ39126.1 thioesterase family protein [Spirochaetota bacterium]HPQ52238.1 thioesterase family protein [Spirochaetota bacterium]
MPRIKLIEQPEYKFTHILHVRISDLNPASHMGASELVGIIHEARVQVLRKLNVDEGNLGDGETGIIMADMAINFRSEAFLFDELKIHVHIGEIGSNNLRFFYRVMKGDTLVAMAETGFVAFSFLRREKSNVPESFITALENYRQN